MVTNYDDIAEAYLKANDHPIKVYVESFTFLNVLGNIQARTILDLACGDGYYTRLIKRQGAAQMVGVDISEEMINRAKILEDQAPLGIEYRQRDVTQLGPVGSFDLVTAVYLFPYASTQQMILAMCQAIYENLAPGGRFVSITLDPDLASEADLKLYESYGVSFQAAGALQDGAKIKAAIELAGSFFELSNFYWRRETYESVLQRAGFREITWRQMGVSEEGIRTYGQDYWQAFLTRPYSVILEGYK